MSQIDPIFFLSEFTLSRWWRYGW